MLVMMHPWLQMEELNGSSGLGDVGVAGLRTNEKMTPLQLEWI